MTVGQRIARKRKEAGLSQEALGEQMGVSRQAIYKWESDGALPEIEKLVALSRLFSVSVGWLLGEEDEAPEQAELTPEQLRMVEAIVDRYLASQPGAEDSASPRQDGSPKPEVPSENEAPPPRRRRWPWVLAGLVLLCVFRSLFSQLNQLQQNYQALQNSLYILTNNVDAQIYGIGSRVEEVLQAQNALLIEKSAEITDVDLAANTATFTVRVMPRVFTEGMTAEFILVSGEDTVTVPVQPGEDHAFTAQITGPLSNAVSLSVALLTGESRESQIVDKFWNMYSESFPKVDLSGGWMIGSSDQAPLQVPVSVADPENYQSGTSQLRLGLFRDKKLVSWYRQLDERPNNFGGWEDCIFFQLDEELHMEPGHTYCLAVIITDEYGREFVYADTPVEYDPEEKFTSYASDFDARFPQTSPEAWDY